MWILVYCVQWRARRDGFEIEITSERRLTSAERVRVRRPCFWCPEHTRGYEYDILLFCMFCSVAGKEKERQPVPLAAAGQKQGETTPSKDSSTRKLVIIRRRYAASQYLDGSERLTERTPPKAVARDSIPLSPSLFRRAWIWQLAKRGWISRNTRIMSTRGLISFVVAPIVCEQKAHTSALPHAGTTFPVHLPGSEVP